MPGQTTSKSGRRTLKVDYLARVEGEGAMYVRIRGDQVADVQLRIFEPPRFFEAFLRDRRMDETVDITARICGICPVAHQMSAAHAIENACRVSIEGPIRDLRRLLYCGEWIESHLLHVFMLHAPDFLGYESSIHMAKDYPEEVKLALELKKMGNDIVNLVGGREIHPINVRVGGFYRAPTKREFEPLRERLESGREASVAAAKLVSSFEFPEFDQDYEMVALSHPDEYPFNEGRLVSNKGLDIDISEFNQQFTEEHVERSNALHCVHRRRGAYHVGPIARFNLNYDKLSPLAKQTAEEVGLERGCTNPFRSIVVRAVETVYAFDEAIRIIDAYEPPERPHVDVKPRAATGHGCTEAPRGILYHRYRIDPKGLILEAQIVPPTAQNQRTIENDLYHFVAKHMHLSDEELGWQCEQAIRNYDPCISCATHFLDLHVDRE